MATRLRITPPTDFLLARDVCSYGYFLLAPNHWDVPSQTLRRVLSLPGGPACVTIAQAGKHTTPNPGGVLSVTCDRDLDAPDRRAARAQLSRMLRLDEDADHLAQFHALDPRFAPSGRGRLFRSPTLFEDVIKTVTSCNVAWPSTVNMNTRFCAVLGEKSTSGHRAFPTPARLARTRPGTLRGRCRVGYRDQRLIDLARRFHRGDIDQAWLENPATPDDAVFEFLKSLPGIGPYAAGNIMQLLGRYTRLAIDTETFRHARTVLGYDEPDDRKLHKQVAAHYEPFGHHRFRSYWFELWDFYESKRGPAHLWDRQTTGTTFTASKL